MFNFFFHFVSRNIKHERLLQRMWRRSQETDRLKQQPPASALPSPCKPFRHLANKTCCHEILPFYKIKISVVLKVLSVNLKLCLLTMWRLTGRETPQARRLSSTLGWGVPCQLALHLTVLPAYPLISRFSTTVCPLSVHCASWDQWSWCCEALPWSPRIHFVAHIPTVAFCVTQGKWI